MVGQARFRCVRHAMLLAALALAPAAAAHAQQESAPQEQKPAEQSSPDNTQTPANSDASPAKTEKDAKVISGMSILGNQDAPKALVIVPWKSSEIGAAMGMNTMLDDSRQPIDKEVFMRMLSYYEIRSGAAHTGSAPTNAAQSATTQRRKQ